MDGLDATRAIRALGGAWRTIPIVALTANAFPEDVKMCRDAGMDDFLSKPMRKKALVERMMMMLADHPLVRTAHVAHTAGAAAMRVPQITPPQPSHSAATPVLDRPVVEELVGIMGEDVRTMFGVFIAETDARLGLFRTFTLERNLVRIVDEAHTLKGAAGTVGLRQLSALAETLEHIAASLTPAGYADLVSRIEASFQAGRAAIDDALSGVPEPA
jgi:CheY-like chemotaxis protein